MTGEVSRTHRAGSRGKPNESGCLRCPHLLIAGNYKYLSTFCKGLKCSPRVRRSHHPRCKRMEIPRSNFCWTSLLSISKQLGMTCKNNMMVSDHSDTSGASTRRRCRDASGVLSRAEAVCCVLIRKGTFRKTPGCAVYRRPDTALGRVSRLAHAQAAPN